MEFIYNDKSYYINKSDNLSQLLAREDLLELPLSAWEDLLLLKGGYVNLKSLYIILDKLIEHYDSSLSVNSFLFNGNPLWLDKATRVGLVNLVNSSSDNVTLALGNQIITIPVEVAKQFLAALEVYAGDCYINTARHRINIKQLKSKEDLLSYDFTAGYPEKLSFNL